MKTGLLKVSTFMIFFNCWTILVFAALDFESMEGSSSLSILKISLPLDSEGNPGLKGRLFLLNVNYHRNILQMVSDPDLDAQFLLHRGRKAEDFTLVPEDDPQFLSIKDHITHSLSTLSKKSEKGGFSGGSRENPFLNIIIENLEHKEAAVIVTLGSSAELMTQDTLKELLEREDIGNKNLISRFKKIYHLILNKASLENSFVYTVKARRAINVKKGEVADFYLLVPKPQPSYMVITHELLHILYGDSFREFDAMQLLEESEESEAPKKLKQAKMIYPWLNRVNPSTLTEQRAGHVPLLWTNSSEVDVIFGVPGVNQITELDLRRIFGLPIRVYHFEGLGTPSLGQSVYELAEILDPVFQARLGEAYEDFVERLKSKPLNPKSDGTALTHLHAWMNGEYDPLKSARSGESTFYNVSKDSGSGSNRRSGSRSGSNPSSDPEGESNPSSGGGSGNTTDDDETSHQ